MSRRNYYHNWHLRNRDLAQTLENYLMRGYPPGGFTTAVLASDLFDAVARADHWNGKEIAEIVTAVLNTCPTMAIGSYKAVEAWCADEDERRSKYATWKSLQGHINQELDKIPF